MIKSLSSLRFVFAIIVFLLHIGKINVAIGHAFFIVLSGFILSMVYEKRILDQNFSFGSFFKKRLLRTYPLHILTLLLAIPLAFSFTKIFAAKIFLNLFSLQVFIPIKEFYFSLNGVSWNLADLLIFYACFPFLIRILSKFSFRTFTIILGLIVLMILFLMNLISEECHHYLFYISPYFRIFDFIFGIYLYQITKKISFIPKYFTASLIEIGTLSLCVVLFFIANHHYEYIKPQIYSVYIWIPLFLVMIGFYFDKGIISKHILGTTFMLSLGKLSFSFYMIHHLVIRYFQTYGTSLEITENSGFVLCFLISLALAYLSNKYFESLFYSSKNNE